MLDTSTQNLLVPSMPSNPLAAGAVRPGAAPRRKTLGRIGGMAMVLALAGASACAPVDEEDDGSEAQDSAYTTRSCGVGPNDAAVARQLNGVLRSKLAGYMNAERVACARIVVRTTLGRGLGDYAAQIAISTTIVETNIDNITRAVDYDSLGLFQQRPSMGWGSKSQLIDPVYATNAFLNAMINTYGQTGWKTRSLGSVAQGVQRSAFPSRYQVEANDAMKIVNAVRSAGPQCPGATGSTEGDIDKKYQSLGGCNSFLGVPITDEGPTVSKGGRYNHFSKGGSIYWTKELGAHEVHGVVRDLWEQFDWEAGPLGYPLTDEIKTPDGRGRYNAFEGGSIYWTEATGAHEVRGAIRDKWGELGWEAGKLGYPTAGEVFLADGVRTDFEHGSITWTRSTGKLTVEIDGEPAGEQKDGGK